MESTVRGSSVGYDKSQPDEMKDQVLGDNALG